MSDDTIKGLSILFVVMIVVLPMGWVLLSNEPPGPFTATEAGQVDNALKASGLNLCEQTKSTWQVAGARGGTSIRISGDCTGTDTGNAVYIHTQNFDSVQNRDAAVRLIQKGINMNDINGAVYTFGSYVIAVQGPAGGEPVTEVVSRVKSGLSK